MEYNLENAVKYHYDRFPPSKLDYERLVPSLMKASSALVAYEEMLKKMPNSELLLGPLITQEAVTSSRMEGTVSTIDEVLRFEADSDAKVDSTGYVSQDTKETVLYKMALQDAQKTMGEGRPLTQSLVKAIHQRLLSEGRGASKSPGMFKNEQNYIADRKKVLFVPISPEKLQEGLDNLFDYIKNSQHIELIKIGIAHVEFEALHPFKDGNGRIGRMLITLLLWKLKMISEPHFYLSDFFDEKRDMYLDTMRKVSEDDDWDSWLEFFFEAIESQAKKNYGIAEDIQKLYEELTLEFVNVVKSKKGKDALDYMFKHQKFRNNKFIKESGIPESTAARFTRELLKVGLLTVEEKGSGRKAALYSLKPLMDLVREL